MLPAYIVAGTLTKTGSVEGYVGVPADNHGKINRASSFGRGAVGRVLDQGLPPHSLTTSSLAPLYLLGGGPELQGLQLTIGDISFSLIEVSERDAVNNASLTVRSV